MGWRQHLLKGPVRTVALGVAKMLQTSCLTRRLWNRMMMIKHRHRHPRWLEIGPGWQRQEGFETLDVVGGRHVDYVADASGPLPFEDNMFDLIYANHVLEHIPWYYTEEVLREWVRVLKPGGCLEVWVPDAYKVCKLVIDAEAGLVNDIPDNRCHYNPRRSPYLWASGRFYWGANPAYPSWHRSMFTPRHLKNIFEQVGLSQVRQLGPSEVRGGDDHGWGNLGMVGTKR